MGLTARIVILILWAGYCGYVGGPTGVFYGMMLFGLLALLIQAIAGNPQPSVQGRQNGSYARAEDFPADVETPARPGKRIDPTRPAEYHPEEIRGMLEAERLISKGH